jgi:hypothetical protein
MRIPDFQIHKLLTFVLGFLGCGGALDCRAVSYAYESENRGVAFADAEDVVLEVSSCGAYSRRTNVS